MKNNDRYYEEFTMWLLGFLPEKKREVLKNALARNECLTSTYTLGHGNLTVYKEGWYVELYGTRSSFSVYFRDDDGDISVTRKPANKNLSKLYSCPLELWASDYENWG